MIIEYLALIGYKRLMLSNIKRFEIKPQKTLQLILGMNGVGKSSVLEELSPVPGNKNDYIKGGSKTIHIRHRGAFYQLSSIYNSGTGTHSFIIDDEEHNKGRTAAVQKELVFTHFKLNKDRTDLLQGVTRFTNMSTAKRREWLTLLSPVDLDFAFSLHKQLKGLKRDQDGVVKHHQQRLTRESQEIPTEGEQHHLRAQIQTLTTKLNDLLVLRNSSHSPDQQSIRDTQDFNHRLDGLVRRLKGVLTQYPSQPSGLSINSAEEAYSALEDEEGNVKQIEALLSHMTNEYQQLVQDSPKRDDLLDESEITRLQSEVAQLTNEIIERSANLNLYQGQFPLIDLPEGHDHKEAINTAYSQWSELIQTFPENREGYYNTRKQSEVLARHKELNGEWRQLDGRQNGISQRLQRLKSCESITCPSCTHQFQPGVDPQETSKLTQELERNAERLQTLNKEIEGCGTYLTEFEEYRGYVNQFRQLVQHTPLLKPVWDVCIEHNMMLRTPRDYGNVAAQWYHTMLEKIEVLGLQKKADLIQHKLRYVSAIDQQALTRVDQQRERLSQQIEEHTQALRESRERVQVLRRYIESVTTYQKACQACVDDTYRFIELAHQRRDQLFQKSVKDETHHTQLQVAQLQDTLSKVEVQVGVINDLTKSLEDSLQAQSDYHVLARAMSPNDGLIGKYLMGFMQNVVKFLNALIMRVWTYPMEVLPSKVEKDELDYRFPLDVNNGAVTPPDISLGSASQRDIVDFAFRLLVMKFLGLEDAPLYLDELGATFDEEHRINLTDFIENMVELGQVEQVFFISHYVTTHGSFAQADICVIDPTNITVPSKYNEHVIIE